MGFAVLVTLFVARLGVTGQPPLSADESMGAVTLDGGILVQVSADQRATLLGEAASVRTVLAEVCRQAEVELRGYAGPDYRYLGKLENVPLDDAFRSLLREHSYVLGLRAEAEPPASRIVWIRVLGGEPGVAEPVRTAWPADTRTQRPDAAAAIPSPAPVDAAAAPASAAPAIPFNLPPRLLFEAFNTVTQDQLDAGQRQVIDTITIDAAARDHFLATDADDLARLFRPYRDAAETVKRLQSLAEDRRIQAKLAEVVRVLGEAR